MTASHRAVTTFIQDLSLQKEPNKLDESIAPIIPQGFDEEMRKLYAQENLNECEEAQPETQEMNDMIKETMKSGWQYDEAIKVWKEAFQQLVHGHSSDDLSS